MTLPIHSLFSECFTSLNDQSAGYYLIQEPQTFATVIRICKDIEMEMLHLDSQREQASIVDALALLLKEPWEATVWVEGDDAEHPMK